MCANLNSKVQDGPLRVTTMNLVSDRDGFIWKGHDQLKVKPHLLNEPTTPIEDGLQVTGILQVLPPAAITCVALQSNWNLVAAGTGHGLGIGLLSTCILFWPFDIKKHQNRQRVLTDRCLCNK